jgi:Family of unknown function (DUF6504)
MFVSQPIVPQGGSFDTETMSLGEPSLPPAFDWNGEELMVGDVRKVWRSHKDDRGDTYVKRHWFEFTTSNERVAVVYFDRGARRGQARWWLYTID